MVSWIWIVIAVIIVIGIAAALWAYDQQRRSGSLRRRFGPEYDRTVSEHGRRAGEAELERRRERVQHFDIRPLAREDRDRFAEDWRKVQARFVDDPNGAAGEADRLVEQAMVARGYPMGEFEQRAADISVDHPRVVENYRAAHAIALRHRRGEASTEDLRVAMVHYRALFEDLLGERVRVAGRTEVQP